MTDDNPQTTKPSKEIKLSFFPEGFNGMDVWIDDFWAVNIDLQKQHGKAELFVHLPATSKNEVLARANKIVSAMKGASKCKKKQ